MIGHTIPFGLTILLAIGLSAAVALAEEQTAAESTEDAAAATQPAQTQPGDRMRRPHHRFDRPQHFKGQRSEHRRQGPQHADQRGFNRQRAMHALFRGVDLTEEQRQQVHEIMSAAKEDMKAWREEHRDEIRELRQQLRAAREDGDIEKQQAMRNEMRELLQTLPRPTDALDDVADIVLTDEQRQVFTENRQKLREHIQNRMQQRRERGPREGHGPGDPQRKHRRRDKDAGPPQDQNGGDQLEL